jgi:hypothetical protein
MLSVGRQMRRVFEEEELVARDLLRKLLLDGRRIPSLPADVVWRMLFFSQRARFPHQQADGRGGNRKRESSGPPSGPQGVGKKSKVSGDYLRARDEDPTLVPFECDLCIFRKLTKTAQPDTRNPQHNLLLGAIRRINLDGFWSRSTATVNGNRDNLKQGLALSALVGLDGPYVHKGPYPSFDHVGYEVAIQMVLMSRRKGRHSPTHLQFNTVRKLRTVYGNQMRAAPEANKVTLSLGDQKGRYTRFTHDKCASLWFYRFLEGCQRRMGQI